VIWARNRYCAIGSENKKELIYLLALLNSKISNIILGLNLKTETEKDFLVSTSAIKEYVNIPKIIDKNKNIKIEIISIAEKIIDLEMKTLSDFVDFSNIIVQKFDNIAVKDNNLLLSQNSNIVKLQIKKNKTLIKDAIINKYHTDVDNKKNKIFLSDLKRLPIIDYEKQTDLKRYIDDLLFALYFDIPLKKIGFNRRDEIREKCKKNRYYKLLK